VLISTLGKEQVGSDSAVNRTCRFESRLREFVILPSSRADIRGLAPLPQFADFRYEVLR
jgi:hypothetical protein